LGTKWPAAYSDLGNLLAQKGNLDEAIAQYGQAIRLDDKFALAHFNLGNALKMKGDREGAVASYREAVRRDPKNPVAWSSLAALLRDMGNTSAALEAAREAVAAGVEDAGVYYNLGVCLLDRSDLDGAEAALRSATRLDPKNAGAFSNLGAALVMKGSLEEGIAALRVAVDLNPQLAEGHLNLGNTLAKTGRFAEALEHLKKAHELGSKRPNWRVPTAQLIRTTEKLVGIDARLQEVLAGRAKPEGVGELMDFALVCHMSLRRHADAVNFYKAAFAADPRTADQFQQKVRFSAAAAAVAAAAGQGVDPPPEPDRPGLRKQARNWLSADLAAWRRAADGGPKGAHGIHLEMRRWLAEPRFSGVRHWLYLSVLPPDEAHEWRALWAEVRNLRDRTAPGSVGPPPREVTPRP
jgi:tetratricopeptide (TPR) repeat protein